MSTVPSHCQIRSPCQPLQHWTHDSGIEECPDAGLHQRETNVSEKVGLQHKGPLNLVVHYLVKRTAFVEKAVEFDNICVLSRRSDRPV